MQSCTLFSWCNWILKVYASELYCCKTGFKLKLTVSQTDRTASFMYDSANVLFTALWFKERHCRGTLIIFKFNDGTTSILCSRLLMKIRLGNKFYTFSHIKWSLVFNPLNAQHYRYWKFQMICMICFDNTFKDLWILDIFNF